MKLSLKSKAAKAGTIPGVRTPVVIAAGAPHRNGPRRCSASTRPKSCARSAKASYHVRVRAFSAKIKLCV